MKVLLLLTLLLFVAPPKTQPVVIDDGTNGMSVQVPLGAMLRVKLMVPTGGRDLWEITHLDMGKLKRGKTVYEQGSEKPHTEFQVFQFRAVGAGGQTLGLRYRLPKGRGYYPSRQTYRVKVIVTKPPAPLERDP